MSIQTDCKMYQRHYTIMQNTGFGNELCNWERGDTNPRKWACRKPWLPTNKLANILDFGCALGHQLFSLWCAGYRNISGVEISPELARLAIECSGGRVTITCQDGRELLRSNVNFYDLIILNDVLEHFTPGEAESLLCLIYHSLVPGGRVVLRTPNMACILSPYSRYLDITHLWGYTEFSIVQLLEAAKFKNHKFVPESYGFDLLKWRPWVPWRHLGLRAVANKCIHRFLFWARSQEPTPRMLGFNFEVCSHKPG